VAHSVLSREIVGNERKQTNAATDDLQLRAQRDAIRRTEYIFPLVMSVGISTDEINSRVGFDAFVTLSHHDGFRCDIERCGCPVHIGASVPVA
jgi:hypothetical protein